MLDANLEVLHVRVDVSPISKIEPLHVYLLPSTLQFRLSAEIVMNKMTKVLIHGMVDNGLYPKFKMIQNFRSTVDHLPQNFKRQHIDFNRLKYCAQAVKI